MGERWTASDKTVRLMRELESKKGEMNESQRNQFAELSGRFERRQELGEGILDLDADLECLLADFS